VNLIGKSLYTTYLFPFEATSALLIIAVVGAVVLARRPPAATSSEQIEEADAALAVRDPGPGTTDGTGDAGGDA
jgi:NADH-quinone oxidoreductase subunit J